MENGPRQRKQRLVYAKDELDRLELCYQSNRYPSPKLLEQLALELRPRSEKSIKLWFQNRRARERRLALHHHEPQRAPMASSRFQAPAERCGRRRSTRRCASNLEDSPWLAAPEQPSRANQKDFRSSPCQSDGLVENLVYPQLTSPDASLDSGFHDRDLLEALDECDFYLNQMYPSSGQCE